MKAASGKIAGRKVAAATDAVIPLTDAQRAELDKRIADYEANPDDTVSWGEVKVSITKCLKKLSYRAL